MFIEIENLKPEPLHVRHTYRGEELHFAHDDAVLNTPVTIAFVLTHKDAALHIEGSVETSILYKCSRCLREVIKPLNIDYDLSYLPHPKLPVPAHEIELKYDDMDVGFYDGVRFDVDLMTVEQIELSIPMRFLCREDCRGLCPTCGADLNGGDCGCKNREVDSRLADLLEFKNRSKNR